MYDGPLESGLTKEGSLGSGGFENPITFQNNKNFKQLSQYYICKGYNGIVAKIKFILVHIIIEKMGLKKFYLQNLLTLKSCLKTSLVT